VTVASERAEEARAVMIELFPAGFEEVVHGHGIELAAYGDLAAEERLRSALGETRSVEVAAGWEDRWREFHRPVRIGSLWVGPPWLAPPPDATPVVIDPGRAFGTGAHPTTQLALSLLLELRPGPLLDIGCGSGVLSIAAAKLGFAPVDAVDVDPVAVETALTNAASNGVVVGARRLDALTAELVADIAVANVSLAVVEALAGRLRCRRLVASGYLEADQPRLPGFRRVLRRASDGWAADLYTTD
jgi:ribosomal protein L11 methyltransferase